MAAGGRLSGADRAVDPHYDREEAGCGRGPAGVRGRVDDLTVSPVPAGDQIRVAVPVALENVCRVGDDPASGGLAGLRPDDLQNVQPGAVH